MYPVYRQKQGFLFLTDQLAFHLGLITALFIRFGGSLEYHQWVTHVIPFSVLFFFWSIIGYAFQSYHIAWYAEHRESIVTKNILMSLLCGIVFFYLVASTWTGLFPKTILFLTTLLAWFFSYIARIGTYRILFRNIVFLRHIALISDTETHEHIKSACTEHHIESLVLHHRLPNDAVSTAVSSLLAQYPKLTIVAPSDYLQAHNSWTSQLLATGTSIIDLDTWYEHAFGKLPRTAINEQLILTLGKEQTPSSYERLHILIDRISGILIGLWCIVLFPLVALAIKIDSRGPVLFSQMRTGKFGQPFRMYKFRTMYALAADGSAETNGPAFASKQDKRITRIGSILRKTRIDELPQAWNLLRGELSLIGPRPERPELIEILAKRFPAYPLRSMITPGITGWAAIQQEYASTLDEAEEKLLYDLYYIKHRSFSLDLIIIIRTIGTVLRMRGQ